LRAVALAQPSAAAKTIPASSRGPCDHRSSPGPGQAPPKKAGSVGPSNGAEPGPGNVGMGMPTYGYGSRRAAIPCRRMGRAPGATPGRGMSAWECRPTALWARHWGQPRPRNVGMGMPTYGYGSRRVAIPCRRMARAPVPGPAPECRHRNADLRPCPPVGRQSLAAGRPAPRCRVQPRNVGMGMPTYGYADLQPAVIAKARGPPRSMRSCSIKRTANSSPHVPQRESRWRPERFHRPRGSFHAGSVRACRR
jgi:hypothetical protein